MQKIKTISQMQLISLGRHGPFGTKYRLAYAATLANGQQGYFVYSPAGNWRWHANTINWVKHRRCRGSWYVVQAYPTAASINAMGINATTKAWLLGGLGVGPKVQAPTKALNGAAYYSAHVDIGLPKYGTYSNLRFV
jgi:hypothetical protein